MLRVVAQHPPQHARPLDEVSVLAEHHRSSRGEVKTSASHLLLKLLHAHEGGLAYSGHGQLSVALHKNGQKLAKLVTNKHARLEHDQD